MTRVFGLRFLTCSAFLGAFLFSHLSNGYALDQTVTDCSSDTDLRAKLAAVQTGGGGALTFNCGTATITLNGTALPDITTHLTVDGGGKITLSGGNVSRIFVGTQAGDLTLENLTLTQGLGPFLSAGQGGAVAASGPLHIFNVSFIDNHATKGGALYATADTDIHTGTFQENSSTAGGGGAISFTAISDNNFFIQNSTFTTNQTSGSTLQYGGAILLTGTPSLTAALFVSLSKFTNNSSLNGNIEDPGRGGAIYVDPNSKLTIFDSTLEQNVSGFGGAIFNYGTLHAERDAFFDNQASAFGGGIYTNSNEELTLINSTFSANSATDGGALMSQGLATVTNVTFSRNSASTSGGALHYSSTQPGTAMTLNDTLFDQSIKGGNCFSEVGTSGVPYIATASNLSSDTSCKFGTGHTGINIKLGPLQDNGGPTLTLLPQPGSPAIDHGNACPATDQRGVARPFGSACDMGAVEVSSAPTPTPTPTPTPGPIDQSINDANHLLGQLSGLIANARKQLPPKPSRSLPASKRNKINAARTAITAARTSLKTDLQRLLVLESHSGKTIRAQESAFTKANLTALKSEVAAALSLSDSHPSKAKADWNKVTAQLRKLQG